MNLTIHEWLGLGLQFGKFKFKQYEGQCVVGWELWKYINQAPKETWI